MPGCQIIFEVFNVSSEPKKALIIRTVKAELIPSLVDKWTAQLRDVSFDILTHYGQTNVDYYKQKFRNIFIYKAVKDFYIHHISWRVLRDIRRNKYDVVIFPHRGPGYRGFTNVIVLALGLGGKQVAHCGLDGQLKYIEKSILLKHRFSQSDNRHGELTLLRATII